MSQTTMGPKGGLHPNTAIAGAVIAQGQQLKRGADQNTLIPNAAATTPTLAIALDDQDTAGRTVLVADQPGEYVLVRAGAAFALDARLTSDATGRAITAATGNQSALRAAEAATAADQLVTAQILAFGSLAP
jgi:hypothetical protein